MSKTISFLFLFSLSQSVYSLSAFLCLVVCSLVVVSAVSVVACGDGGVVVAVAALTVSTSRLAVVALRWGG